MFQIIQTRKRRKREKAGEGETEKRESERWKDENVRWKSERGRWKRKKKNRDREKLKKLKLNEENIKNKLSFGESLTSCHMWGQKFSIL